MENNMVKGMSTISAKALLFSRLGMKKVSDEDKARVWAFHDGGKFHIGAVVRYAEGWCSEGEKDLRFIVLERWLNPSTGEGTHFLIGALNSSLVLGHCECVDAKMIVLVSDRADIVDEETERNEMKKTVLRHLEGLRENARSAWERGVLDYAEGVLLENIFENRFSMGFIEKDVLTGGARLREMMLNGAKDWKAFSYGGCADIYDEDIALTLCTKSELKRTDNGRKAPNKTETWLDVQARALAQAAERVKWAFYQTAWAH